MSTKKDKKETKAHLTPSQYFAEIKSRQEKNTNTSLDKAYQVCGQIIETSIKTGQMMLARKSMFTLNNIEKERKLLDLGIDTFVYRDDVLEFVEIIENNVVKCVELENYERNLPAEIVKIIEKTKDIFDEFFVVFTDYKGIEERKIVNRDKDPVLFGAFITNEKDTHNRDFIQMSDRLYFLGDWVDDYCDLTFEKMVYTMLQKTGKDITMEIITPNDIDEFNKEIMRLTEKSNQARANLLEDINRPKNKSFFHKVFSALKKK